MPVLLMLISVGVILAGGLAFVASLITRQLWLAKFTLGAVGVWLSLYVITLLGVSWYSHEKVLAVNEPKEFCGFYLDCHLHVEVTGIRTAEVIADKAAVGKFYIISVEVFSDARNPDIKLGLIEPRLELIIDNSEKLRHQSDIESGLRTGQVDLGSKISKNQTLNKEIVFDVPFGSTDLRLDVSEGYGVDKLIETLLIGDEDSLLHKRTFFDISQLNRSAGL